MFNSCRSPALPRSGSGGRNGRAHGGPTSNRRLDHRGPPQRTRRAVGRLQGRYGHQACLYTPVEAAEKTWAGTGNTHGRLLYEQFGGWPAMGECVEEGWCWRAPHLCLSGSVRRRRNWAKCGEGALRGFIPWRPHRSKRVRRSRTTRTTWAEGPWYHDGPRRHLRRGGSFGVRFGTTCTAPAGPGLGAEGRGPAARTSS